MILPDSGFRPTENGFGNKKYHASIVLINLQTNPDVDTNSYNDMVQQMAELKAKDPEMYNKEILLDTVNLPGNGRVFKIIRDNDSLDVDEWGRQTSQSVYYYKYKSFRVLIAGNYDSKYDAVLHEPFLKSLASFRVIDSALADNFFKTEIYIGKDYAPLKYVGKNPGGILLNMEGKYPLTGGDSSYCRIVPVNLIFPLATSDDVVNYLRYRLSIHAKIEIGLKQYTYSHGNVGNFRYYSVTKEIGDRIFYFCIKADERGYFEVWGEAYHNNKKLVDVFEKISYSLKRG